MSRQKLIGLWNDWQLSALVLLSLFLQLLFLSTAGFRRRMRPSNWSKAYFWGLYNVSPPIAIYALGILSRASAGQADADIQAFWAAVLLFHLAGPDDFTALSLEDNYLWVRRCFTLAIQAATTAYVFFHYFQDPAFRRFIAPFCLIFVAGLLKCVEQGVALQQATMKALIESVLGIPDAGPDYAGTMDRVNGFLRSGVLPSLNIDNERVDRSNSDKSPVEAYDKDDPQQAVKVIRSAHLLFSRFKVLFADGIFSFKDRQDGRAEFSKKGTDWAFKVVEIELSFMYDRLYSKASVSRTNNVGIFLRIASLLLTLAGSLWALLVTLHNSKYKARNRCVTYTLLLGAVLTDVFILASHSFSIWSLVHSDRLQRCSCMFVKYRRWSGYMAQSNLIGFCLKNLPSESELGALGSALGSALGRALGRALGINALVLRVVGVRAAQASHMLPVAALGALLAEELEEASTGLIFKRPLWRHIRSRRFWSKYKKVKNVPVRDELKDFIFQELREKERRFIDWESRRQPGETSDSHNPFTSYRGDHVLKSEAIAGLEWSLQEKEFEESLLIWHIATDLCFRREDNQENSNVVDPEARKHMDMARELSNYLFYIIVVHPLMLSPSTTMATKRCRDTCAEARRHFLKEHLLHIRLRTSCGAGARRAGAGAGAAKGNGESAISEENAHASLLRVETPVLASVVKGDKSKSVLWDGCFLAKELNRIMQDDRKTKWRVVCRVWVEMLCHAAIHCGGYQHAERLKEGGELITFVCLLMTHLGMGKHYRTEVGDAYAHLTAYTA